MPRIIEIESPNVTARQVKQTIILKYPVIIITTGIIIRKILAPKLLPFSVI